MSAAGCLDCSIALCRPDLQRGRVDVEIRRYSSGILCILGVFSSFESPGKLYVDAPYTACQENKG